MQQANGRTLKSLVKLVDFEKEFGVSGSTTGKWRDAGLRVLRFGRGVWCWEDELVEFLDGLAEEPGSRPSRGRRTGAPSGSHTNEHAPSGSQ